MTWVRFGGNCICLHSIQFQPVCIYLPKFIKLRGNFTNFYDRNKNAVFLDTVYIRSLKELLHRQMWWWKRIVFYGATCMQIRMFRSTLWSAIINRLIMQHVINELAMIGKIKLILYGFYSTARFTFHFFFFPSPWLESWPVLTDGKSYLKLITWQLCLLLASLHCMSHWLSKALCFRLSVRPSVCLTLLPNLWTRYFDKKRSTVTLRRRVGLRRKQNFSEIAIFTLSNSQGLGQFVVKFWKKFKKVLGDGAS